MFSSPRGGAVHGLLGSADVNLVPLERAAPGASTAGSALHSVTVRGSIYCRRGDPKVHAKTPRLWLKTNLSFSIASVHSQGFSHFPRNLSSIDAGNSNSWSYKQKSTPAEDQALAGRFRINFEGVETAFGNGLKNPDPSVQAPDLQGFSPSSSSQKSAPIDSAAAPGGGGGKVVSSSSSAVVPAGDTNAVDRFSGARCGTAGNATEGDHIGPSGPSSSEKLSASKGKNTFFGAKKKTAGTTVPAVGAKKSSDSRPNDHVHNHFPAPENHNAGRGLEDFSENTQWRDRVPRHKRDGLHADEEDVQGSLRRDDIIEPPPSEEAVRAAVRRPASERRRGGGGTTVGAATLLALERAAKETNLRSSAAVGGQGGQEELKNDSDGAELVSSDKIQPVDDDDDEWFVSARRDENHVEKKDSFKSENVGQFSSQVPSESASGSKEAGPSSGYPSAATASREAVGQSVKGEELSRRNTVGSPKPKPRWADMMDEEDEDDSPMPTASAPARACVWGKVNHNRDSTDLAVGGGVGAKTVPDPPVDPVAFPSLSSTAADPLPNSSRPAAKRQKLIGGGGAQKTVYVGATSYTASKQNNKGKGKGRGKNSAGKDRIF